MCVSRSMISCPRLNWFASVKKENCVDFIYLQAADSGLANMSAWIQSRFLFYSFLLARPKMVFRAFQRFEATNIYHSDSKGACAVCFIISACFESKMSEYRELTFSSVALYNVNVRPVTKFLLTIFFPFVCVCANNSSPLFSLSVERATTC